MSFRTRQNKSRNVKSTVSDADGRKKRGDIAIALRKKGREEQLQKRRQAAAGPTDGNVDPKTSSDGPDTTPTPQIAQLPELKAAVFSNDVSKIKEGTRGFRKLLSIADNPPIEQVLQCGVVPRFVQFLKANDEVLVFEAAWALTNIASGNRQQTQAVLQAGAVPIFVHLLGHPNKDVKEQSVWALGNIAGDCHQFRDLVLSTGALRRLMQLCAPPHSSLSLLRNATWALSNLCRGKPQPDFQAVKPAIACFTWLLNKSTDEEVLTDAAWALSYITDDNTEDNVKIQAVLDSGIAPRLVQLLGHHLTKIQTPILRTVGNIVTGNDKQTQTMIDTGVLGKLIPILVNHKRSLRKEACWTLSNITAGNEQQIDRCIRENVLPPLITVLRGDEFSVQKEACWALSNITNNGKHDHIQYMVKQGFLPPLCNMLPCSDSKIVMVALEGIENTLKVGQKLAERNGGENLFCDIIEECNGVDKLERLQEHDNDEVYEKAQGIITTYFRGEDEDDDTMGLAPENGSNEFSFNSTPLTGSQGGFNFGLESSMAVGNPSSPTPVFSF